MLEGIICPSCENTIDEIDLKDSLKCPHCSTDLKDRRYLDFLEFLMANGIVENLDFFDHEVYSDDVEENEGIKDYTQFEGINDDWEEFNERDFSSKKGA